MPTCILPVKNVAGMEIVTIEGLGNVAYAIFSFD
jgi:aerobic-type carbon monoxide dehydrogenase small subunit (CoxS/CutS family)